LKKVGVGGKALVYFEGFLTLALGSSDWWSGTFCIGQWIQHQCGYADPKGWRITRGQAKAQAFGFSDAYHPTTVVDGFRESDICRCALYRAI